MNGNSVVIDSNIVIHFSKGILDLSSLYERYDDFFVSIVTYIEVLGHEFPDEKEKKLVEDFFSMLRLSMSMPPLQLKQ